MKARDPDFYEFLQKSNKELLRFGQDLSENDEVHEAVDGEDLEEAADDLVGDTGEEEIDGDEPAIVRKGKGALAGKRVKDKKGKGRDGAKKSKKTDGRVVEGNVR